MPDLVTETASIIDHALLQPTLTQEALEAGCRAAIGWRTASVCVLPFFVRRCAELLRETGIRPSTVIGFPHGTHHKSVKRAEVRQALADGAEELDMVVNLSWVASGAWDDVRRELHDLLAATHEAGAKGKVILETGYWSEDQKVRLCSICAEVGADWVKTSTGFGPSGATVADVALLRRHSPPQVQVKAAGGIRTLAAVLELRTAGATRIGTSRTAEILKECRDRSSPKR